MNGLQIFTLITMLTIPSLSLRIDKCRISGTIPIKSPKFLKTSNASLSGYINAELNDTEVNGVIFVKNITFIGDLRMSGDDDFVSELSTRFDPMIKEVRVQRIIEYRNKNLTDDVRTKCNLGFVNNYDLRMGARYGVEQAIFRHTESCFRKLLCNFDPERHRIGDDLVVMSKSRNKAYHTTSQKTVNSIIDLAVRTLVNGLVAANKSVFQVPEYNGVIYEQWLNTVSLKFEGGSIDILPYIKRNEDFTIAHEGKRFIIGTAANLTGGTILLKNFTFTHQVGFVKMDYTGTLPVKPKGIGLRAKISLDYNVSPCKISLLRFDVKIPEENVNFAESLGSVAEDILTSSGLKSSVIDKLIDLAKDPLKNLIENSDCEVLRARLFGAKRTKTNNPSTTTLSP